MNLTDLSPQQLFLIDEIWILTFSGASQRNKIYKEDVSEKAKSQFRKELKFYLQSNVLPLYVSKINQSQHVAILISIIDISKYHKDILLNGELSIGTAQKLLNLFLKYYWCLGWVKEPPHFPI